MMRGIGAKTGLGARAWWWYVWFIVLGARMDCRGVFGGVAGLGGGVVVGVAFLWRGWQEGFRGRVWIFARGEISW